MGVCDKAHLNRMQAPGTSMRRALHATPCTARAAPAFRMADAARASVDAIMDAKSAPWAQLKPRPAKPSTKRMTARMRGWVGGGRGAGACERGEGRGKGKARVHSSQQRPAAAAIDSSCCRRCWQSSNTLTRREDDGAHGYHHKGHEHRVHPQLRRPGSGGMWWGQGHSHRQCCTTAAAGMIRHTRSAGMACHSTTT